MDKEQFLILVEEQLSSFFMDSKGGKNTDPDKYRAEGFMRAGRLMGLVTKEDLDDVMEQAHAKIYDMSIAEHERQRRDEGVELAKEKDYQDFFSPAYIRGVKYREQKVKPSATKS